MRLILALLMVCLVTSTQAQTLTIEQLQSGLQICTKHSKLVGSGPISTRTRVYDSAEWNDTCKAYEAEGQRQRQVNDEAVMHELAKGLKSQ